MRGRGYDEGWPRWDLEENSGGPRVVVALGSRLRGNDDGEVRVRRRVAGGGISKRTRVVHASWLRWVPAFAGTMKAQSVRGRGYDEGWPRWGLRENSGGLHVAVALGSRLRGNDDGEVRVRREGRGYDEGEAHVL